MSSAIDTTVDFRRKLLRFDRPLYPQYRKSTIPRFYSNFTPHWRSYYSGPGDCDTKPERYDVEFPLRNIESSGCVNYYQTTIGFDVFDIVNVKKLLLLLLFLLLCSTKKLFYLVLIVCVLYFLQ